MVRLLHEQADDLAARIGAPLELVGIAVRRPAPRPRRPAGRPGAVHHRRAGPGQAGRRRRRGRGHRRHRAGPHAAARGAARPASLVVTANKALLAEDGATLHAAADKHGADLYYEAAVAGAIPLLRPLRESLAGDRITRVLGIVNGTTNFILSRMDRDRRRASPRRWRRRTALGYAEADPTADVEGFDAAAKAAILAALAFHTRVTAADVYREGITEVTAADVASAKAMGCVVKLLVHRRAVRRTAAASASGCTRR